MATNAGIPADRAVPSGRSEVAEEMAKIPYEPLLPIQIKLIVWSLIVGAVLLVVLCWTCSTFFKV